MQPNKNDSRDQIPAWKNNAREAIYLMAAFYILFMAYKLYHDLPTSVGNEKMLMLVFVVIFITIGVALIGFVVGRMIKKHRKK